MISWFIALYELSIGEYCPDVNRRGFRVPDVIRKQTRASYHAVFLTLYQLSDRDSEFSLNASDLSHKVGYSRKTIYEAIAFLKRVNLLQVVEIRTGRGNHSRYQLNWRKPELAPQTSDSPANRIRPAVKKSTAVNSAQKCHPPLLNRSIKENIHPSGDKMLKNKVQTSQFYKLKLSPKHNPQIWKQAMKQFRLVLAETKLSKAHRRLAIGVIGRAIKNRDIELAERLYAGLVRGAHGIEAADWVSSPEDFCRWFRGVVNVTLAEEHLKRRPKAPYQSAQERAEKQSHSQRQATIERWRNLDVNERQWQLVQREKGRIARRRGSADSDMRAED